jgi:hypothetical protein
MALVVPEALTDVTVGVPTVAAWTFTAFCGWLRKMAEANRRRPRIRLRNLQVFLFISSSFL